MEHLTSQNIFIDYPELLKSQTVQDILHAMSPITPMVKITAEDLKNSKKRTWTSDVEVALPQTCRIGAENHYISYELNSKFGLIPEVQQAIQRVVSCADSRIFTNMISRFRKQRRNQLKEFSRKLDISSNFNRVKQKTNGDLNVGTFIDDLMKLSYFSTESINENDKAYQLAELVLKKMVEKYSFLLP